MSKKKTPRTNPVVIECRLCPFVATGSTWRPTRKVVAAHIDKKHGKAGRV